MFIDDPCSIWRNAYSIDTKYVEEKFLVAVPAKSRSRQYPFSTSCRKMPRRRLFAGGIKPARYKSEG